MKRCPNCKKEKKNDAFGIRYGSVLRSYCRVCECKKKKAYDEKKCETVKERARKRYRANAESEKNRAKKYRQKNKEKLRAYYRKNSAKRLKRQAERVATEPKFRLRRSVSACMRGRISCRTVGKRTKSTFDSLPYTVDELMRHLESQFLPGMSWDNYGLRGWHVDHKIPDSNFSYESVDDDGFRECWDLRNLQPLWAEDNLSKGNKII